MDMRDLYIDHEHLLTKEEREELNHSPRSETIPTIPPFLQSNFFEIGCADADGKEEFLRNRKPAFGLTTTQLDAIQRHHDSLPAVQRRILQRVLRETMLRSLIPADNARTINDHLEILRAQLTTNELPPIPAWYKFSSVSFGPRRLGFRSCESRECARTETAESSFKQCSKCKLANYCSRDCQGSDWTARHKEICKKADAKREMAAKAGSLIEAFRAQLSD